MSNNPPNIWSGEINIFWTNIVDFIHCPIQSYSCSAMISNYSFRLPRGTRSIKQIKWMGAIYNFNVLLITFIHNIIIIILIIFNWYVFDKKFFSLMNNRLYIVNFWNFYCVIYYFQVFYEFAPILAHGGCNYCLWMAILDSWSKFLSWKSSKNNHVHSPQSGYR